MNVARFNHMYLGSIFIFLLAITFPLSGTAATKQQNLLSEDESNFLRELGVLKVMVDDKFEPITYFDQKAGIFKGIAVDALKEIADLLRFEYEIIRVPDLDWQSRLNKIRDNEIHILGGASKNATREEYGYFSEQSYFDINYALISSITNPILIREMSDLRLYKIGLVKGVTINEYILDLLGPEADVQIFSTKEEALDALRNHIIDLYPQNEAVFTEEYFEGLRFDFEISYSMPQQAKSYAFFCPKTEDGLRLTKILDKGLNAIDLPKIVASNYSGKSIFQFYKEHTERLQEDNKRKREQLYLMISILVTTLLVGFVIWKNSKKHKELSLKLQTALDEIKTLSGFLPICATCKKIRDDKGYWNQIENYIRDHSKAEFSHSICPECEKKYYDELNEMLKK